MAFVLNISGNFVDRDVKDEISRALDALTPDQSFTIIGCGSNGRFSPIMLKATPENIEKASHFLEGVHFGTYTTKPSVIVIAAIDSGAEVVWFAADVTPHDVDLWPPTRDPTADEELSQIRKASQGRKVRINTTLKFLPRFTHAQDPAGIQNAATSRHRAEFLKRLARENGGICIDADGNPVGLDAAPPLPAPPRPSGRSVFHE